MKIAVAGTGYVGLSIATLLAQHNTVTAVDIIPEKVDTPNNNVNMYTRASITISLSSDPISKIYEFFITQANAFAVRRTHLPYHMLHIIRQGVRI